MIDETAVRASPATPKRCDTIFGWVPLLLLTLSLRAAAANDLSAAATLSSGRAVIATGGGTSSGGDFSIDGTIGQADADPLQPSMGGDFAITGGFWFTLAPAANELFADGFEAP